MLPLTVSLLVCCVLLVAAIFAEVTYYNPSSTVPFWPDSDQYQMEVQDTAKDLEFPPMSDFREIVDRPLFNPSRRPIVASAKPMPPYRFRGALLMGKRRIGLLERLSDGVLIRVREGDVIDEWQITSIDGRSIQVSSPTQTHTIALAYTIEEDTLSNDIQQKQQVYNQNRREEGRNGEKSLFSNLSRRYTDTGRTCLQSECRAATSETRTMKQALAALITRLPAPPPLLLRIPTPDH